MYCKHGVLLYAKSQSGSVAVNTGESCCESGNLDVAHLPIMATSESHIFEVRSSCETSDLPVILYIDMEKVSIKA